MLERHRGIATIIGASILAVTLLAIIALYIFIVNSHYEVMREIERMESLRISSLELKEAINVTYNVTQGDLIISLNMSRTYGHKSALVTGVLVVWNDSTITYLDRWNTTSNVRIILNGAEYVNKIPIMLTPGDNLTIILQGSAVNRQPHSIYVSISSSPTAIVLSARRDYSRFSTEGFYEAILLGHTANIISGWPVSCTTSCKDDYTVLLVIGLYPHLIDVYRLHNMSLEYISTSGIGSVFNGSTVIGCSCEDNLLVLFNSTGIYALKVGWNGTLTSAYRVTGSCRALLNAYLGIGHYRNRSYAVVLPGYSTVEQRTNDSFCVVDLKIGRVVSSGRLSSILGIEASLNPNLVYSVSASNGSFIFFVVSDGSKYRPILIGYSIPESKWHYLGTLPISRAVGMSYGGGVLWILGEHGGLYCVNPNTGRYSLLTRLLLPFYPQGPGNRLEFIRGLGLLFVRGDSTTEIWLIPYEVLKECPWFRG